MAMLIKTTYFLLSNQTREQKGGLGKGPEQQSEEKEREGLDCCERLSFRTHVCHFYLLETEKYRRSYRLYRA